MPLSDGYGRDANNKKRSSIPSEITAFELPNQPCPDFVTHSNYVKKQFFFTIKMQLMQHQKFVKTASLLGATLAIIACTFLFSASSSVEQVDHQAIKNLATEISALNTELATMKTAQAKGAVDNEPMIGEIRMFAGNFAPVGWAFCNGQILPINDNQSLFSLLGTTYGGDGRRTFALPDLRGRAPVGFGNGPGLADRYLGTMYGTENSTVKTNKIAVTPAQGRTQNTMAVSDIPNGVSTVGPRLAVTYIIAIQGLYPRRN